MTTEMTYGFIVLGQVQVAGVAPARQNHLSVVVHRQRRGDRFPVSEKERRDGLRF